MNQRTRIKEAGCVQFITHFTDQYTYLDAARMALEGGCKWIQLRMKDTPVEEIERVALEVQKLCKAHDAVFVIDDEVELVKKIQADGVHLGKNDMPVDEARSILGDNFIIGGTANTFGDIASHVEHGADYIGCGPFRFTTTKKNLSPVLGLDGYSRLMQQMKAAKMDTPLVAIGGITNDDIPLILQIGVNGIALSGSILRAENPVEAMQQVISIVGNNNR